MKILLLNDNPVVGKLVTLSAQKSGDELVSINAIDQIDSSSYDLFIVDDGLYTKEIKTVILTSGISVKKMLFMASRGAEKPSYFDSVLNKPFLPTDLVELFIAIASECKTIETATEEKSEDVEAIEGLDDDFSLELEDDILDLDGEISGLDESDDTFSLDDDLADLDELNLDELESSDELELDALDDILADVSSEENVPEIPTEQSDGVLDAEELQEVQNLLDDEFEVNGLDDLDTQEDSLEDELILDDVVNFEEDSTDVTEDDAIVDSSEDELLLDEELNLDLDEFENEDIQLEDEKSSEDEMLIEDEIALEEDPHDETNEEDTLELTDESIDEILLGEDEPIEEESLASIEDEIESAMSSITQDELDEELSTDALLEIADAQSDDIMSELDDIDPMQMKVALGEADESEIIADEVVDDVLENEVEVEDETADSNSNSEATISADEGIATLQTLIDALSNKEVTANMKNLNISINIAFKEE